MNVIETRALGKRYRRGWALRDCTLTIPGGHIAALVGPNGAGKTTLLTMAVGLTKPTAGALTVLGGEPPGSPRGARPHRLRRPGRAAVPEPVRRRHAARGTQPEPALGPAARRTPA